MTKYSGLIPVLEWGGLLSLALCFIEECTTQSGERALLFLMVGLVSLLAGRIFRGEERIAELENRLLRTSSKVKVREAQPLAQDSSSFFPL